MKPVFLSFPCSRFLSPSGRVFDIKIPAHEVLMSSGRDILDPDPKHCPELSGLLAQFRSRIKLCSRRQDFGNMALCKNICLIVLAKLVLVMNCRVLVIWLCAETSALFLAKRVLVLVY